MQLKILFILTLTRHVSAAVGHHQVFLLTETLIDASKKVGLEVNAEKTKYMLLSRHQNAGKNHDIKIADRCFENVTVETFMTNRNKSKRY
jgi:hypothetical protein